jgi:hypothetical protein
MGYKIVVEATKTDGTVCGPWEQRAWSDSLWNAWAVANALVRTGIELSDKHEITVRVTREV